MAHAAVLGLFLAWPSPSPDSAPRIIVSTGDAGHVMQIFFVPPQENDEHEWCSAPSLPERVEPGEELVQDANLRVEIDLPELVLEEPEWDEPARDPVIIAEAPGAKPLPPPELSFPTTENVKLFLPKKRRAQPVLTAASNQPIATPSAAATRGIDREADVREHPSPVYPYPCRKRGQEGDVIVRVTVSPEGKAEETVVERPSPYKLLNESALAAARRAEFIPALRDGTAVRATVRLRFRFVLG